MGKRFAGDSFSLEVRWDTLHFLVFAFLVIWVRFLNWSWVLFTMFVIIAVVIIIIISATALLSEGNDIILFWFEFVVPWFPQRKMGIFVYMKCLWTRDYSWNGKLSVSWNDFIYLVFSAHCVVCTQQRMMIPGADDSSVFSSTESPVVSAGA